MGQRQKMLHGKLCQHARKSQTSHMEFAPHEIRTLPNLTRTEFCFAVNDCLIPCTGLPFSPWVHLKTQNVTLGTVSSCPILVFTP